jgi:hypothetical protein
LTFVVTFRAAPTGNPYRNLRGLLRVALRRFRLRAVNVEERQ